MKLQFYHPKILFNHKRQQVILSSYALSGFVKYFFRFLDGKTENNRDDGDDFYESDSG